MSNFDGNAQYPCTDGTGQSSQPTDPQDAHNDGVNSCIQFFPDLCTPNFTAYTPTSQIQNVQNLNEQSSTYQHAPSVDEPYFGAMSQSQTYSLPVKQPTTLQDLGSQDIVHGAQPTTEYIFVNYVSDDFRQQEGKRGRFKACKSCQKGRHKCERPHKQPRVPCKWCVEHKKVCETEKTPGRNRA